MSPEGSTFVPSLSKTGTSLRYPRLSEFLRPAVGLGFCGIKKAICLPCQGFAFKLCLLLGRSLTALLSSRAIRLADMSLKICNLNAEHKIPYLVRPFLTRKFFEEILGLERSKNFENFREVHNLNISDRLLRSKSFFQENIPGFLCSVFRSA